MPSEAEVPPIRQSPQLPREARGLYTACQHLERSPVGAVGNLPRTGKVPAANAAMRLDASNEVTSPPGASTEAPCPHRIGPAQNALS